MKEESRTGREPTLPNPRERGAGEGGEHEVQGGPVELPAVPPLHNVVDHVPREVRNQHLSKTMSGDTGRDAWETPS